MKFIFITFIIFMAGCKTSNPYDAILMHLLIENDSAPTKTYHLLFEPEPLNKYLAYKSITIKEILSKDEC